MSKKITGPWYFKFRIKFTIISLAAIVILVYLGTWQLGRAYEKQEIILQMQEKINGPPLLLANLSNPQLEGLRFTPILVYGTYLNKYTFLLDNQMYKSQVGYRVLTILQSPYLSKWLLVDRGWVPVGPARQVLPEIKDVYGVQTLTGIINTIPSGIVLQIDKYDPNANWPILIQKLDFPFIQENLHHPIYDFVMQLQQDDPKTYPMPETDLGLPSDKHFGYALQWFSFAALALIYYLITSISRHKS